MKNLYRSIFPGGTLNNPPQNGYPMMPLLPAVAAGNVPEACRENRVEGICENISADISRQNFFNPLIFQSSRGSCRRKRRVTKRTSSTIRQTLSVKKGKIDSHPVGHHCCLSGLPFAAIYCSNLRSC